MRQGKEKLIIVGAGEPAEMAHHYFTRWSQYEVVAFSAEKGFIDKERLLNLPVVPFEHLEKLYEPKEHKIEERSSKKQRKAISLFKEVLILVHS